jgi:hypothetical protein
MKNCLTKTFASAALGVAAGLATYFTCKAMGAEVNPQLVANQVGISLFLAGSAFSIVKNECAKFDKRFESVLNRPRKNLN